MAVIWFHRCHHHYPRFVKPPPPQQSEFSKRLLHIPVICSKSRYPRRKIVVCTETVSWFFNLSPNMMFKFFRSLSRDFCYVRSCNSWVWPSYSGVRSHLNHWCFLILQQLGLAIYCTVGWKGIGPLNVRSCPSWVWLILTHRLCYKMIFCRVNLFLSWAVRIGLLWRRVLGNLLWEVPYLLDMYSIGKPFGISVPKNPALGILNWKQASQRSIRTNSRGVMRTL
jgi:hypothetical protein